MSVPSENSSDHTSPSTIDAVHRELWSHRHDDGASLDRRIRALISASEPLAAADRIDHITSEVTARVNGLGPLHDLAMDDRVSEIMVNGDGSVWVERAGQLERTSQILDAEQAEHLIRRLAAQVGRRVDQTRPSVDVRLDDGSRLHAIIPPLAVDGPCITIRRFVDRAISLDEMASPRAFALLTQAVVDEKTIVVAGGTSSGKTTLLNALGANLDPDSRVVTIEDAAELALPGRHVVRLETRVATEGTPPVGLRELVRHALRMRPDRIICGEMRGAEALDLVQAMNTGHGGSLSTVHANSPVGALRRIETMMMLAEADLPIRAVRDQIASCVDLVVMTSRHPNGDRRVTEIAAVPTSVGEAWALEPMYSSMSREGASQ